MTLEFADHLVIKRNGVILGPEDEAYHEFVVIDTNPQVRPGKDTYTAHPDGGTDAFYHIVMQVVA